MPLRPDYEHALVVLQGSVAVDGVAVEPGVLAYLGLGRDECRLEVDAPARALLLGGVPFPEPILMWWNFVGRSREELSEARRQWSADDGRFGRVRSSLQRIEVGSTSLGVSYQSPQPGGLTVPVMARGSTGSRVAPAS